MKNILTFILLIVSGALSVFLSYTTKSRSGWKKWAWIATAIPLTLTIMAFFGYNIEDLVGGEDQFPKRFGGKKAE